MISDIISIQGADTHDGVTYYQICSKVPLRQISVEKRYSDFQKLVRYLSEDLGISQNDFPYKLPAKTPWFKNSVNVTEYRKVELSEFLNSIVKDSTLQNNPIFHEFLNLPTNFRIRQNNNIESIRNEIAMNVEDAKVNNHNFLELLTSLGSCIKRSINDYSNNPSIASKITIQDLISKKLEPALLKLSNSLNQLSSQLDFYEMTKRESKLQEVKDDLAHLQFILVEDKNSNIHNSFNGPSKKSINRIIGNQSQETAATISQNNKELLLTQLKIRDEQDQNLEDLRKIINRQKQIGVTINNEVEEQIQLLDSFNQEVDSTADKVQVARSKAKNIL